MGSIASYKLAHYEFNHMQRLLSVQHDGTNLNYFDKKLDGELTSGEFLLGYLVSLGKVRECTALEIISKVDTHPSYTHPLLHSSFPTLIPSYTHPFLHSSPPTLILSYTHPFLHSSPPTLIPSSKFNDLSLGKLSLNLEMFCARSVAIKHGLRAGYHANIEAQAAGLPAEERARRAGAAAANAARECTWEFPDTNLSADEARAAHSAVDGTYMTLKAGANVTQLTAMEEATEKVLKKVRQAKNFEVKASLAAGQAAGIVAHDGGLDKNAVVFAAKSAAGAAGGTAIEKNTAAARIVREIIKHEGQLYRHQNDAAQKVWRGEALFDADDNDDVTHLYPGILTAATEATAAIEARLREPATPGNQVNQTASFSSPQRSGQHLGAHLRGAANAARFTAPSSTSSARSATPSSTTALVSSVDGRQNNTPLPLMPMESLL
jgi:hypothetical protein